MIAVFVVTADFERSHDQSVWTEPSFTVAQAESEPASVKPDSQNGTATASVEASLTSNTTDVVTRQDEKQEDEKKEDGEQEEDGDR